MPGMAARVGSMTAHGGTVTGPGCPTVLIGGLPAACVGDMHVCPMVTPAPVPVPHVGGPITGPGVPTVLMCGRPAATVMDLCVCVGPPSSIIIGAPNVLIGTGGGGGGGGGSSTASSATAQGLKSGTIKPVKGSETFPIEIQAAILEASKYLAPEQTEALIENAKKDLETKSPTIADFVDVLKGIESEEGKEAARFYAGTLDYSSIQNLAVAYTRGDDTNPKNDPNKMPTRFMILYGADDSKLQSIDDHPDKTKNEDHKMNVANLRKALKLLGYEVKENGPYNDELYAAHFQYIGKVQSAKNPYQKTHKVKENEHLGSIARLYGIASWKYLYDKNKDVIGDNPDLLMVGIELNIPKWDSTSGDEKLKAKEIEPEIWANGLKYQYPWVPLSFSLTDGKGEALVPNSDKDLEVIIRNRENGTALFKGCIKNSDELELLIPDAESLNIGIKGSPFVINGMMHNHPDDDPKGSIQ